MGESADHLLDRAAVADLAGILAVDGSAMFVGVLYMQLSSRESNTTQRAALAWLQQIYDLVDLHDYQDDGHLAESLDEAERDRVIAELRRMPAVPHENAIRPLSRFKTDVLQ